MWNKISQEVNQPPLGSLRSCCENLSSTDVACFPDARRLPKTSLFLGDILGIAGNFCYILLRHRIVVYRISSKNSAWK